MQTDETNRNSTKNYLTLNIEIRICRKAYQHVAFET